MIIPISTNSCTPLFYVRPEFLSENTDLCKRMIGAVVKSAAWIRSVSVEEVAQAIRPFFASLDEKVFLGALGNVREAVIPNGRMSAAGPARRLGRQQHAKVPYPFAPDRPGQCQTRQGAGGSH